jgi:hypothetical protein
MFINYPSELTVVINGQMYDNHMVSRDGKIRSLHRNKYLSCGKNKDRYQEVVLSNSVTGRKTFRIHRIVASTFIPNPDNLPLVNHKDGNIHNNHENNLEWCSTKENSQHAHDTGLQGVYKRSVIQYTQEGKKVAAYESIIEASLKTGVASKSICNVCRGTRNMAEGFRWTYKEDKLIIKPYAHCRKVNQIDPVTKQIVDSFESAKEAAEYINMAPSWMAKCCKTSNFVSKGFIWEYAPEIKAEQNIAPHISDPKMYVPLTIKGNMISGYFISRNGEIWSEKRKRFLTQNVSNGYYSQCISYEQKVCTIRTHRHIASAFVPNPNNYNVVNHIDGNKLNNNADNLEWCTTQQNCQHAYNMGLSKATKRPVTKFSLKGEKICVYDSVTEAAKDVGVLHQNIYEVCNKKMCKVGGYKWTYANEENTLSFKNKSIRLVDQLDLNTMEIIATHDGVTRASVNMNCTRNRIDRACKRGIICEGYKWQYHDESNHEFK